MVHSRRRHRRRNPFSASNPRVLGIELEDGLAVAGGIWGAKNLAAAIGTMAAPVLSPINSIRPGLGMAVAELVSAWGVGRVVRFLKPQWATPAALGGAALALSDGINALAGNVNLISGSPALNFPGLSAASAPRGAAALPPPSNIPSSPALVRQTSGL